MATETLIIVVGGDYLAYEICREILKTAGQRIALVWKHDDERAQRLLDGVVSSLSQDFPDTFSFHNADPSDPASLVKAGLAHPGPSDSMPSAYLVAVSQDDRLNLRVALLARDIDERVRVTIRQFNPVLGHKIQEGLKHNCTVISPAAHAAATYAASAVDPSCFYALPFPALEMLVARAMHRAEIVRASASAAHALESGALFGFCERAASEFGIETMTVPAAEERLQARIVAIDGVPPYLCHGTQNRSEPEVFEREIAPDARVVAFGPIQALKECGPIAQDRMAHRAWSERLRDSFYDMRVALRRTEPILRTVFVAALALFAVFVAFFTWNLHLNVLASMYFVVSTMSTVGYGDITPCVDCASRLFSAREYAGMLVAMFVMLAGITVFAVFTATVTSGLQAATVRRLRGLRRIDRSGHVIVCGSGNVGSLVIDYLRELGERVVVVERNPDAILIELARDRKVDLLTGDATNDETIAYCSPERAKSLVGVTNSDTANLEVALGARTRTKARGNRDFHVVLRIDDLAFGASIKRHFGIASFSTTELTAPTIAGLARFESTRGRFDIFSGSAYSRTFQLAERLQNEDNPPPPPPLERPGSDVHWIPLYVWRDGVSGGKGVAIPVRKFEGDVHPGDRLLFMVPLDQFHQ